MTLTFFAPPSQSAAPFQVQTTPTHVPMINPWLLEWDVIAGLSFEPETNQPSQVSNVESLPKLQAKIGDILTCEENITSDIHMDLDLTSEENMMSDVHISLDSNMVPHVQSLTSDFHVSSINGSGIRGIVKQNASQDILALLHNLHLNEDVEHMGKYSYSSLELKIHEIGAPHRKSVLINI